MMLALAAVAQQARDAEVASKVRGKKNRKKKRASSAQVRFRINQESLPLSVPPKKLLPPYLELLGLLVLLGADALLRELLRGELEVEDLVEGAGH